MRAFRIVQHIMLKHVHLADAAELVSDNHYRDVLLAMSHGLHPFCVHEPTVHPFVVFFLCAW